MDLVTHQQKLLSLLRSTYHIGELDDPYIRKVAQSPDLAEARKNILLWRIYVLQRTAPLSFNLLKRRRLLEDTLNDFIERHNISPFRETQAPAFLEVLSEHSDSLVASVAQFELALLRVKSGDASTHIVAWDVEPHTILDCLAKDTPIAEDVPRGVYRIHISREYPYQFKIFASSRVESDVLVPKPRRLSTQTKRKSVT
jgi:hypothetical protein